MYGIFTYIWLKFMVNVAKLYQCLDPMGKECQPRVLEHDDVGLCRL